MSDLRTLLDEASQRPPAPDPVAAVHRRVRRRATRRRTAVAAGATLAAAATGIVVLDGPAAAPPASSPTASPSTAPGRLWRAVPRTGAGYLADGTYDRIDDLVRANPGVFVGFQARVVGPGRNHYEFAFAAGHEPLDWAREIDRLVGRNSWNDTVCPRSAAYYDQAASDVLSAPWPSGTAVRFDNALGHWMVSYDFPCVVVAVLDTDVAAQADIDYARERWGGDVRVIGQAHEDEERGRTLR